MGTVKTFNGIFALLASQLAMLVLIAFENATFTWSAPSAWGEAGLAGHLMMTAVVLALMWLAWSALLEPVEIYWGTSANVRLQRWLLPALLVTALVFVVAAVTIATRLLSSAEFELFAVVETSLLLPIAATALLIVSALRRRKAIQAGIGTMRNALKTVGSSANLNRIEASIDWEESTAAVSVRANPRGFTFAGLTSKPWHDPAEFGWIPSFVEAVDALRDEAQGVLSRHDDRVERYHYVGLDGDFWHNLSFVKRHEEVPENLALCPVTAALLKTVPGYPTFRDAMYSILGPTGVIRPHRDVSNVFLTLHLPLVVPEGGYIEVGGIRREWRYGEPLVFDSSYTHEAVNPAYKPRLVLLVDFLHPDLTEVERDWIRASRI